MISSLLLSLLFGLAVGNSEIHNFGKLDRNQKCVFGTVEQISDSTMDDSIECSQGNCQMSVGIKDSTFWKPAKNQLSLALNLSSSGQTLHTLSEVYVTLTYPEKQKSFFLVSLKNLDGHHKDLLESLEISFPLDMEKINLTVETLEIVTLGIRSKCSCDGAWGEKKLELFSPPDVDMFRAERNRECPISKNDKVPQWLVVILIGAAAVFIILCFLVVLFIVRCKKGSPPTDGIPATPAGQIAGQTTQPSTSKA